MDDAACPRCDRPLSGSDARLSCRQCGGTFLGPLEVRRLLIAATDPSIARDVQVSYREAPRPAASFGQAAVESARYLRCPVCERHMNRTRVIKRSGVIADACMHHGVWLDSGEAEQLAQALLALALERDPDAGPLDGVDAALRALALKAE